MHDDDVLIEALIFFASLCFYELTRATVGIRLSEGRECWALFISSECRWGHPMVQSKKKAPADVYYWGNRWLFRMFHYLCKMAYVEDGGREHKRLASI